MYPSDSAITLAHLKRHGVLIEVAVRGTELLLNVIDFRDPNPLAPKGLRRFRPSLYPAPIYVVTGNFDSDSMFATQWLEDHHANIRERESERGWPDLIIN